MYAKKECKQVMKKVFMQNGVISTATEAQKQVFGIQTNASTSLIDSVQLHSKVNRDVDALHWMS